MVAPSCTIWSTQTDADFALKFLSGVHGRAEQRFIGIHPGSGGEHAVQAPGNIDRFIEYLKESSAVDVKILVFGGKDESALGPRSATRSAMMRSRAWRNHHPAKFRTHEARILFLSNDSSPRPWRGRGIPQLRFSPHVDIRTGQAHALPFRHSSVLVSVLPGDVHGSRLFQRSQQRSFACLQTILPVESVLEQIGQPSQGNRTCIVLAPCNIIHVIPALRLEDQRKHAPYRIGRRPEAARRYHLRHSDKSPAQTKPGHLRPAGPFSAYVNVRSRL